MFYIYGASTFFNDMFKNKFFIFILCFVEVIRDGDNSLINKNNYYSAMLKSSEDLTDHASMWQRVY